MKNLIKITSIALFTILQAYPTSVVEMMQKDGITNVVGWIDYKKDSDKDGIADYLDKCPNTPINIKVDNNGCAIDSDKDGITDNLDKCPNTIKGIKVDNNGCEIMATYMFNFKIGSDKIDKKYYPKIKKLADILKENPNIKIEIEGHTDNIGSEEYNYELSLKRANSLKNILINEYKIDPKRIKIKGFGATQPIASNKTKEGRMKNRRIVVINTTNKITSNPILDEEYDNYDEKEDLPVNYVK